MARHRMCSGTVFVFKYLMMLLKYSDGTEDRVD